MGKCLLGIKVWFQYGKITHSLKMELKNLINEAGHLEIVFLYQCLNLFKDNHLNIHSWLDHLNF